MCVCVGGGGDQNFLGWSKWGASFFSVGQREELKFYICKGRTRKKIVEVKEGDQNFTCAKGGAEKNWRPAITNRQPPLPVKNDSSLNRRKNNQKKIKYCDNKCDY